jgi:hypothetical protein
MPFRFQIFDLNFTVLTQIRTLNKYEKIIIIEENLVVNVNDDPFGHS